MLSVKNITKTYWVGKHKKGEAITALQNVSIDFPETGFVFLLGKSGSGKSTLLNVIGGLDTFDSGEIIMKGKSSKTFTASDFDSYRNTFVGFIFQEYNILNEFSVGKNLEISLELQGKKPNKEDVEALLEQVDLKGYYKRKPNQLSGGQKQRVAIARALIKDPEIIMADEPTGALDSATGKQVMETLKKLSAKKLVIVVTHDREFAELYGDRIIELQDGKIIRDISKIEQKAEKLNENISFISGKVIHIKKGQTLTNKDLSVINEQIQKHAQQTDTFISFDERTNDSVKKAAFITDADTSQTFVKTTKEHIAAGSYLTDQCQFVKSKLKFKDACKIGASSLKHKPFRLFITILLSFLAFTMFGIADTMASFERHRTVYDYLSSTKPTALRVTKDVLDDLGYHASQANITKDEITTMRKNNPNNIIKPVLSATQNLIFNAYTQNFSSQLYTVQSSGVMHMTETDLTSFGLELIAGKLPTTNNEICISEHHYNCLARNKENNLSSPAQLINKTLTLEDKVYTITGVMKNNINIFPYEQLEYKNMSSAYQMIQSVVQYSMLNMLYVTSEEFETLTETQSGNNALTIFNETSSHTLTSDAFTTYKNVSSFEGYLREDVRLDTLKENQIIVPKYILEETNYTEADIANKTAKLLIGKISSNAKPFEIVGYQNANDFIVSDTFYEKNFSGYQSVAISYNASTNNAELVKYFESSPEAGTQYTIQFAGTEILNDFSSLIYTLSRTFIWVGLALALFSAVMLANFIATSIAYKKREIGILRALGARGRDVFAIFFIESAIICLINFVLAAIATPVCTYFINASIIKQLGVDISILLFGVRQVALLFASSAIVALLASFVPVYSISKKNPVDSINNR